MTICVIAKGEMQDMLKNKDGKYRSSFVVGKSSDGKPERITVYAKTKKELGEKLAEAKRLRANKA